MVTAPRTKLEKGEMKTMKMKKYLTIIPIFILFNLRRHSFIVILGSMLTPLKRVELRYDSTHHIVTFHITINHIITTYYMISTHHIITVIMLPLPIRIQFPE